MKMGYLQYHSNNAFELPQEEKEVKVDNNGVFSI